MRVLHLAAGNIYGGIERALVAYAAGRAAATNHGPTVWHRIFGTA